MRITGLITFASARMDTAGEIAKKVSGRASEGGGEGEEG